MNKKQKEWEEKVETSIQLLEVCNLNKGQVLELISLILSRWKSTYCRSDGVLRHALRDLTTNLQQTESVLNDWRKQY